MNAAIYATGIIAETPDQMKTLRQSGKSAPAKAAAAAAPTGYALNTKSVTLPRDFLSHVSATYAARIAHTPPSPKPATNLNKSIKAYDEEENANIKVAIPKTMREANSAPRRPKLSANHPMAIPLAPIPIQLAVASNPPWVMLMPLSLLIAGREIARILISTASNIYARKPPMRTCHLIEVVMTFRPPCALRNGRQNSAVAA
jgi:hypothetical protein